MQPRNQLGPNCFNEHEKEQIREAVQKKYSTVAVSAEGKFKYQTGKAGAALLHYDKNILSQMSDALVSSFCGVGNPFIIEEIAPGSVVLDVGSGAGFDLVVASRLVGTSGKVHGIDLTKEMVERSKEVITALALKNIEVHQVSSEKIPLQDQSVDVVISNGVINLSPGKAELFAEIYRVLKPGGRFQFADILLDKDLPPSMASSLEAWSQ